MKKKLKWLEKQFKENKYVLQSECAKHGITNLKELINKLNSDGYDIKKVDEDFEIKYIMKNKKQKTDKINPFDVLQGIIKKKLYSKEDVESCLNIYLLIQFLKGNQITLNIAEYLNQNWKMSLYEMYLFAYTMTPKSIGYIKWIKTEKPTKNPDIEILVKHYMCSYEVAERIYKMLSKNQLQSILEKYTYGGIV